MSRRDSVLLPENKFISHPPRDFGVAPPAFPVKIGGMELTPLREILEKSGAQAGDFYLLRGRGRVLAALPANPIVFLHTLSLYRPQKIRARLGVLALKILHHVHAHGLALTRWSWPGSTRPTLPCPGVLVGNPSHPVPRAMFLLPEEHTWLVGKFIADPAQQEILHREKQLLDLAARQGGHAPRCRGWKPCGQGGALWTEWIAARQGNPSHEARLQILQDWLLPEPPRPLASFPAWQTAGGWPGASALQAQKASQIQLRPCLRHGDFAPWNLLQKPDRTWVAVDWEEGTPEDAPGLDLIHDLLQREFLIRRSSFPKARERVFRALRHPAYSEYLAACGWLGQEPLLLDWALALEAHHRPEIKKWADFM